MGYMSSYSEQNKREKRKKTVVYSTQRIQEILDSMNSGYEPDMTPFFENDIEFKDANVPFELTEWEEEERLRCSVDPEYFIARYVQFQTDYGYKTVQLREYQKEFIHLVNDEHWDDKIETFVPDNQYVISMQSRQMGKTTTICASFLHYILFHNERNMFITANKGQTTSEIINKLTEMLKRLPWFLKPGIVKKNQSSIKLDNGCYVYSSPASKSPATGFTVHFMYIDEAALIPSNIIDDYWKSVFPTLSSSKVSKIVLTSTPRGRQNLFYRLWDRSEQGKNSFVTFRADWWQNPEHDEAWAAQQKADFGEEEFAQEFELQWDVAASKLIRGTDSQFMARIKKQYVNIDIPTLPKELSDCFWWHPDFDPLSIDIYKQKFVMIGDTAEGKEIQISGKNTSDYNVLQIFKLELMPWYRIKRNCIEKEIKITDCFRFRQVGVYMDNFHDEGQMGMASKYLIHHTFCSGRKEIDNVRVLIEMNFNGKNFLEKLMDSDFWYDELVFKTHHTQPVPGKYHKRDFGFKTTSGGKGIGKSYFCEEGAKMITQRRIIVSHYHPNNGNLSSIAELNAFDKIRKTQNSDYFVYGGVGLHDDLAYSILNCSRAIDIPEYKEWIEEYFENGCEKNLNWLIISKLLKKAAEKSDEGISDKDFSKMYAGGESSFPNPMMMQPNMMNMPNPYSNHSVANPYLNRATNNPYLNRSQIQNPYLRR